MGLKKRNKVNAEFSMSSLTDIIFLLLIFFMLTANFVRVDSFDLPESDSKTVAPISVTVGLEKNGNLTLNGKKIGLRELRGAINYELSKTDNRQNATVTVVAEKGVAFKRVQQIMEIAKNLNSKIILATQPRKS